MSDELESPPISFNRQIGTLELGESLATAKRLDRVAPETADISAIKARLRASINPAVSKARKRYTGMEFVTDTGEFLTQDGHVVVVVTVTRIG